MSHPSRDVTGLLNPTPPAGSIPVRFRCEIRAVTSMDARGEPASRAGETRAPRPEKPVTHTSVADFTSLGLLHHPPSWTSLSGADQRVGQVLMNREVARLSIRG